MKIILIYRRDVEGSHSISTLFDAIKLQLTPNLNVIKYVVGSKWRLPYDLIKLKLLHGDIYHITGDVHYFSIFFPRKKTVLTIHDLGHYTITLKGIKRWIYKWLWLIIPIYYADIVTTISESTKKSILNDLGSKKDILLIPNCYNQGYYFSKNLFRDSCPVLLQVGTKVNKNLERVIEAIRGVSCMLRIIGRLSEKQVELLKLNHILYENVYELSPEAMVEEYINADIVIFISLFEGFGVPILEANLVGRALITSNREPMKAIAGDSACLANPEDVEDIRRCILKIITDDIYRDKLIHNGELNVKKYSPQFISENYKNIYLDLIRK